MKKPKILSQCCGEPIYKMSNGEWTEWYCPKCRAPTDEDGREYRYSVVDGVGRRTR